MTSASPRDAAWHPTKDGWSRACRAVTLGLFAFLAIRAFSSTFVYPDSGDMDFGSYYRAGQYVREGETPYQPNEYGPLGTYPYAPAYAFLMVPFTWLDYITAFRCWQVLNWLATFACFRFAVELIRPGTRLWPTLLLTTIAVIGYIQANVLVGQAGMMVLLGCIGWAVWQRRGKPFVGGLCLATACALKLAPFVFVPYLLLRRDGRGLAGVATGLAGLFLLPTLCVGIPGSVRLHSDWAANTCATQIPLQTMRRGNQSLLAELARLPAVSNGCVCYSRENLDTLLRWYPVLLGGLALALYGLLWRRVRLPNVALTLLLLFMMLGHPRAWRCNFVTLIFPAMLLAETICHRRPGWRFALGALLAVPVACALPTDGLGADGIWSWWQWLLQGKHFWAGVAVATACWRVGRLAEAAQQIAAEEGSDGPVLLPFRKPAAEERRKAA